MSVYLKTHIVQKGETLEDIVSKYNIPDVKMLRHFHNQNSPKQENYIGSMIFPGDEIFIPDEIDVKRLLEDREKRKSIEINRIKIKYFVQNF